MEKETVREINGIKIERYKGTRKHYFINIREGKGWREFQTFTTIKSAVEFAEAISR